MVMRVLLIAVALLVAPSVASAALPFGPAPLSGSLFQGGVSSRVAG